MFKFNAFLYDFQIEYYDSVDWQMLLIINTLHLTV
jgi:hypothetical protein